MATFEFISLKCVSQNEVGGDEITLEYTGIQVFPAAGMQAQFRSGDVVVNLEATLDGADRERLLEVAGAHPVEPFAEVGAFLHADIQDIGLVVEVWEHDVLTANDLMGKIVVFPTPTKGPVTKTLDTAMTGVYEITYQVL